MKQFVIEYGLVILSAVAIVFLIGMATPLRGKIAG